MDLRFKVHGVEILTMIVANPLIFTVHGQNHLSITYMVLSLMQGKVTTNKLAHYFPIA